MIDRDWAMQVYDTSCESMREIPDNSIQCCVCSPPYWGLRDYGIEWKGGDPACDHRRRHVSSKVDASTLRSGSGANGNHAQQMESGADCPHCGAQRVDTFIGLEETYDAYMERLLNVFREVRRVLRPDGTLWVNMGDSYNSGTNTIRLGSKTDVRHGFWGRDGDVAGGFRVDGSSIGLKPKDLLGMPWRLAIALQASQYIGRIRYEADRTWLAALVDGEGCITALECASPHGSGNSYAPILQVRMCDIECIEQCARITGYGNSTPAQSPPSQEGQRPSFQWRLNSRKAADIIAEIYPHLLIKRKQAVVAWNLQDSREGYQTKAGVKIPEDAVQRQIACRDLLQRLNRREAVDIPTWMKEPKSFYEPGWYLRSDCIWHKPAPMPSSVADRPTPAHEYIFLLSKSARYFYDADAIREPFKESSIIRLSEPTFDRQEGGPRDYGTTGVNRNRAARKTLENVRDSALFELPEEQNEPLWGRTPYGWNMRPGSHDDLAEASTRREEIRASARVKTAAEPNPNVVGNHGNRQAPEPGEPNAFHPAGANKRDVWTMNTESFGYSRLFCPECGHAFVTDERITNREDAPTKPNMRCRKCNEWMESSSHFATFPLELPLTCIRAGTSEGGACAECGAPYRRVVERDVADQRPSTPQEEYREATGGHSNSREPTVFLAQALSTQRRTVGFEPSCKHQAGTVPCVVLDPFGGTGTTAVAAEALGRSWVLYEISAAYRDFAQARLRQIGLPLVV